MNHENSFLTFNQFGAAARSKRETYDMLTIKGGYYLPPIDQANSDYISDILSGDKKVSIYLQEPCRSWNPIAYVWRESLK